MFAAGDKHTLNFLEGNMKRQSCISKIEDSIQTAFDELSTQNGIKTVTLSKIIRKCSFFVKGDYYISLKSSECCHFFNSREDLTVRLKKISYVNEIDIDLNYNLTFFFNRPVVYKSTMIDVLKHGEKYGMVEGDSTVLLIVSGTNSKNLDSLRSALSAEHIISFLAANNIRVHYIMCEFHNKSISDNTVKLVCSEKCSLLNCYNSLRENAKISEYRVLCLEENCLCIDGKKYMEKNALKEKYGKGINNIKIAQGSTPDILIRTASFKHLLDEHISYVPDHILHIASHGQKNVVLKAGLLLEILDKCSNQIYVIHHATYIKDRSQISVDDFLIEHKKEIEKAMTHKYDPKVCEDKLWASRIEILADTAVKFNFLKINPNMTLKLQVPNDISNSEKSRGIFVQYNYARLSNIFKNFEFKVRDGYYEPLLSLEDVDFSLLKLEEEWNLFNYILSFPKVVQGILDSLLSSCVIKRQFPLNRICTMLHELCHDLSIYYSKIRILAGPQPHLQKVMHARLWLLKGIYQILSNSFKLLNIQGLDQM